MCRLIVTNIPDFMGDRLSLRGIERLKIGSNWFNDRHRILRALFRGECDIGPDTNRRV